MRSSSSGFGKGTDVTGSSTPPSTPYGSSTPRTTEEKRIKALSKAQEVSQTALKVSQMANRTLLDIIHDFSKLPIDDN